MNTKRLAFSVKRSSKVEDTFDDSYFLNANRSTLYANGFTLLEVLLGVVLLVFISVSLYVLYSFAINMIWESRVRIDASALANERMERVRNVPYDSVGTIGGIPQGTMAQSEQVHRNNVPYTIETSVVYIDDPFDGTLGGTPNDTLSTDYKRVRIEISWPYRLTRTPVVFLTDIVPNGVESDAEGGTLQISVFNSFGMPVPTADVHIVNTAVSPAVNLHTQTNASGILILPGAPPSIDRYEITVTKSGYSTDRTYASSAQLPSPAKPHVSVFLNQTSPVSFAIDSLGTFNVTTNDYSSNDRVGNISFKLSGAKSIGTDSNGLVVLKYSSTHSSDVSGLLSLGQMEWDGYTFSFATSTTHDLAGINPLNPVVMMAGSTTPVDIYVAPKSDHSLLVAVQAIDGALLNDALVQIDRIGFTATSTTPSWGQVFFRNIEASQYDVSVTKTGYQNYEEAVAVSGATQKTVTMTPL